jgi:hypothetical protein
MPAGMQRDELALRILIGSGNGGRLPASADTPCHGTSADLRPYPTTPRLEPVTRCDLESGVLAQTVNDDVVGVRGSQTRPVATRSWHPKGSSASSRRSTRSRTTRS